MKVIFAGGNGYTPEFSGGVQSSTHHLAEQLIEHGHEASVLAALFGDGFFGFRARAKMKLLRQPAVIDSFPGYPVVRAWFPWEAARFAVEKMKPDVAVVQCHKSVPLGKALQAEGVPVVVYLRNVEFHELGGDLRELNSAHYIANSEFTARTYKREFGIDSTVLPPTINPALYSTPTTGEFVTFINPNEEKGFDLAVKIGAACPEIPFLFVESWKLDDDQRARIGETIAPFANIKLESRTNDMKTVYGRTRILLAPSKWEEAWGRVASEAHCSGIPVVGSRRGGLPEAIGSGGVVLDYDAPLADWVEAVRRLWNDRKEYERLSTAARAFSERAELDPERQFATFFALLDKAAQQRARRAA
ncbi:glycosyltransferase [Mesorhizobium sp.]|uniref:glycosyltransferase n=1 Tax=Mesorhizobium sp. TaxID=1871066 RepID=UPI000FE3FC7B|nr:glycosyltransferase [Mesorhizobium sp.]RWG87922.1 MAG: glycosyltransferase [Mesorhizobium sp.]RWG91459.1 MAG: glycosyltransferase [Mesorhizobium sp.]RWK12848.1 MAG: glycosyltransferase [Mesorhizobium sp.]RWK22595.1 MAG: glycosyltransferase [Mesorhizobium sp.]TIQ46858.1 MAG: glycosyltransferase [Mesorhizobium sp.]